MQKFFSEILVIINLFLPLQKKQILKVDTVLIAYMNCKFISFE